MSRENHHCPPEISAQYKLISAILSRCRQQPVALLTISRLFFKITLFVFVLVVARIISASEFADFQFISSLANMLAQPMYSLSMIVVYIGVSIKANKKPEYLAWLIKTGVLFSLCISTVVILTFILIEGYLGNVASIHANFAVILGGVIVSASVIFYVVTGILMINQRFLAITTVYFIIGTTTLTGGYLLTVMDAGQLTAYSIQAGALLISSTIAFVIASFGLPKANKPPVQLIDWAYVKYSLKSIMTMLAFFIMLNTDILAVKIITHPLQASFYLQQELVSKLFFVIGSSVGLIVFARVMQSPHYGEDFSKFKPIYILYILILIGGLTMVSDMLADIVFGRDIQTNPVLVAMLLSGRITQSLVFILISTLGEKLNRKFTGIILICACLEVSLMAFVADTIIDVAMIMASTGWICLLWIWWMIRGDAALPPKQKAVQV